MKRYLFLIIVMQTLTISVALSNPFSSLKPTHWTYKAINRLLKSGIIKKITKVCIGDEMETRFALGCITERIYQNYQQLLASNTQLGIFTKADLQTLNKLKIEFRDEISLIGVRVVSLGGDDMEVIERASTTTKLIQSPDPQNDEYKLADKSLKKETMSKIETDIAFTLPQGSVGLNMFFQQTAMFDNVYVATIIIPKDSKDSLVRKMKVLQQNNKADIFARYAVKDVYWWKPSEKTLLKKIAYFTKELGHIELFLCNENGTLILYVCCAYG